MRLSRSSRAAAVSALIMAFLLAPSMAGAHGFAGKRFFPTTFQVEDPFVSDEFSVLFNHIKEPEARNTEVELELSKRITQNFGLTVGESFKHQHFAEGGSAHGFGNLELGAKYQFFTSDRHETILSFGTSAEIGGTGASKVGADSFSTISPALFFGKGFGDLPDAVKYLKPLAVTGVIGPNFPTQRVSTTFNPDTGDFDAERHPTTLSWALSLQYSLMYLQSFVEDVGLVSLFKRMVLVVEFPMETCISSGCNGQTTGTINPGVLWAGKTVELGIAAQIPVNSRTGRDVGVLALFHVFIDDLFPKSLGRPIFQ